MWKVSNDQKTNVEQWKWDEERRAEELRWHDNLSTKYVPPQTSYNDSDLETVQQCLMYHSLSGWNTWSLLNFALLMQYTC